MFGFDYLREWSIRRSIIKEARALGESHQTALADSTQNPLVLAAAAVAVDDSVAASAYWEEARLKLSPTFLESEKTIDILLHLKRFGELQDFLDRWPDRSTRWLGLARLHEARSEYQEALQWWSMLRRRNAHEFSGYFGEARCLEHLGKLTEVVNVFKIAIQFHVSDRDCWLKLARSAEAIQSFDDALTYWKHLAAEMNCPEGYAGASRIYRLLGDQTEAQYWLMQGLRKHPVNGDLLIAIAEESEQKGLWEDAAAYWKILRQAYPKRRLGYDREIKCLLQINLETEAALLQREEEIRFRSKKRGA